MTKREYLISLGLAREGRGRFSRDGMAALAKAEAEGMTFDDAQSAKTLNPQSPIAQSKPSISIPPQVRVREWNLMRGTTDDGLLVEWGTCGRCSEANMYCKCAQPKVPHGVTAVMLPATLTS